MSADLDRLLIVLPRLPGVAPEDMAAKPLGLTWRVAMEWHECALCTETASTAIIMEPGVLVSTPRWLDLCPRCYHAVHALAVNLPDDGVILQRAAQLEREGLIPPP